MAGKEAINYCKKEFPTEEILIQAIKSGNRQAEGCLFRMLYKSSIQSVRKYVISNNGNEEAVKDLFQDAYLIFRRQIVEGTFEYRHNTKLSTYFYRVCANRWIDELRKKYRREAPDEPRVFHDPEARSQEAIIIEEEETTDIRLMVRELGEICYRILTLYYWHKWDLESIASEMNRTPETVKNQKYRCMKRLREKCNV